MNQERPDMQEWEEQINALLDGELDDSQAEALKLAAGQDQALATAIIEAYQLQQLMAAMPVERAPDSLRAKLQAIPEEQTRRYPAAHEEQRAPWWSGLLQPRWAVAMAVIPLVVIIALQTQDAGQSQSPGQTQASVPAQGETPRQFTEAELVRARQDFVLALNYLQKASSVTGREIETSIGTGMSEPVMHNTVRTIADQLDLDKEQEA